MNKYINCPTLAAKHQKIFSVDNVCKYLNIKPESILTYLSYSNLIGYDGLREFCTFKDLEGICFSFIELIELYILNKVLIIDRYSFLEYVVVNKLRELVKEYYGCNVLASRVFLEFIYRLLIKNIDSIYLTKNNVPKEVIDNYNKSLSRVLYRIEYSDLDGKNPAKNNTDDYAYELYLNDSKTISVSYFNNLPIITQNKVNTIHVSSRYQAGDSIETLADDYNLPKETIRDALIYELGEDKFLKNIYY